MIKRNTKTNTIKRDYIFGGLIRCPNCGSILRGSTTYHKSKYGTYVYKMYRCSKFRSNRTCDYNKAITENTLERLMIENVEKYLDSAKIELKNIQDGNVFKMPKENVEKINEEIDRLNYSWQTGKIRSVELYEKQYSNLAERLEKAKTSENELVIKDYSKIS